MVVVTQLEKMRVREAELAQALAEEKKRVEEGSAKARRASADLQAEARMRKQREEEAAALKAKLVEQCVHLCTRRGWPAHACNMSRACVCVAVRGCVWLCVVCGQ